MAAGALCAAVAAGAATLGLSRQAVLGPLYDHPERGSLRDAGLSISPARWELIRISLLLGTAAVCVLGSLPFALTLAAPFAPSVWLRVRRDAARDRARIGVTHAMRLVHAGLRSGAVLPDALRRAADAVGPLAARPLVAALDASALGRPLDQALVAVAGSCDWRTARALETLAIGLGERLPLDRFAGLVGALSDRLRFEDQLAAEVHARASGARLQLWLLAATVPALTAYLAFTVPSLGTTLLSPLGLTVLLPGSLALEAIGIVLGRQVVRGALN